MLGNSSKGQSWTYIGDIINGVAHGRGYEIWSSGDWYEGDFVNGIKNGYGIYVFSTGGMYLGGYVDDKRHGYGCYLYSDGRSDEGHWNSGTFLGQ